MGIERRILPPYEEHHDGDFDGYGDRDHHRDLIVTVVMVMVIVLMKNIMMVVMGI